MTKKPQERSKIAELRSLEAFLRKRFENEVGITLRKIRDYVLPELGRFNGEKRDASREDVRARNILVSTAEDSNNTLASGFQSGLTNPSQIWFRWRPTDSRLLEQEGVRGWFDEVERIMYQTLANSNFYPTIHGAYTELGPFGVFDMLMEEDDEDVIRFTHLPVGSFFWATDARHRVDTCVWQVKWTARQLVDKFGEENLSEATKEKYYNDPDEWVECISVVQPRKNRNPEKEDILNMPFAHYVFEANAPKENAEKSDQILFEGGYNSFPHLCARWFQYASDIYSPKCPGISSLPDILNLQASARIIIETAHKAAKPPMRVPTGYKSRLKMMPGAQNFVSPQSPDAVAPLYSVNAATVDPLRAWIDGAVQPAIRSHFFYDVFRMFTGEEGAVISATEVLERKQEKMLLLGPVIERFQQSVLDPLLDRLFNILYNLGKLPELPEALEGSRAQVEYVSVLAQAQKSATRGSIEAVSLFTSKLAQLKPEVLDKVDFDQMVDEYHTVTGAPATILRSDQNVQIIRDARVKAAQQAQKAQADAAALEAGKAASEVSTDPSTLSGQAAQAVGLSGGQ